MKLRSKEPYWLLRNGIINSYPSLRKDISGDVLIVGGGISGALMAYQFSSEGYNTILIDKRDIGFGSTSATTSMIQYEIDEPLYSLIELVGEQAAIDTYTEGVTSIIKLEQLVGHVQSACGLKNKESLYVAHTAKEAEKLIMEFQCRKKAGIQVRWLTKEEIKSTYGVVGEGGILSASAASLDAYKLTHDLLHYSAKNFGLRIYDHTALEKVEYGKTSNVVLVENSKCITCNHLVYATGYETQDLIRADIGKLTSTYACISEPFESLPDFLLDILIWNTQDPYFYCRSTLDNRIIIGGEDEDFKNAERRDALIPDKEQDLIANFNQLMPGIEFIPDFSWAGTFGITKDSLPYIGSHPKYPNSYFMLGFGGNGITFSIMGTKILSDAVSGKSNKFLDYFKFDR